MYTEDTERCLQDKERFWNSECLPHIKLTQKLQVCVQNDLLQNVNFF